MGLTFAGSFCSEYGWMNTHGGVSPSPRGGMSPTPRGNRGSCLRGGRVVAVGSPRGRVDPNLDPSTERPVESAGKWSTVDEPEDSKYSTWSSLPAREFSSEEEPALHAVPAASPAAIFDYSQKAPSTYVPSGPAKHAVKWDKTPRSGRWPSPPLRKDNRDSQIIRHASRRTERDGAGKHLTSHDRQQASPRDVYTMHPLVNPAGLPLMDRLAQEMFLPVPQHQPARPAAQMRVRYKSGPHHGLPGVLKLTAGMDGRNVNTPLKSTRVETQ